MPEAAPALLHDWQLQMGVNRRIAMSREMLNDRNNAGRCNPLHHIHAHSGNQLGGCSKRTITDDRVLRVAVNIKHRGKSRSKPMPPLASPRNRRSPQHRRYCPLDQPHDRWAKSQALEACLPGPLLRQRRPEAAPRYPYSSSSTDSHT